MIPIDPAPNGQVVYVGFTIVALKGQIATTLQKVNYLGIAIYGVCGDRHHAPKTHREIGMLYQSIVDSCWEMAATIISILSSSTMRDSDSAMVSPVARTGSPLSN